MFLDYYRVHENCLVDNAALNNKHLTFYRVIGKEEIVTLKDICHSPLKPSIDICNIQSIWAYWQDDVNELEREEER